MAEGRRPTGRARGFLYDKGSERTIPSPSNDGSSEDENVSDPKLELMGRSHFIREMRAKLQKEKLEKSKREADTLKVRSQDTTPEVESITEKVSEIAVTGEDTSARGHIEKQGCFGEKKLMLTNYIKLITDPNKHVFEYEIEFEPGVASIQCRFKLVYKQFHEKRDLLCYDGANKLFTPEKITNNSVRYKLNHPIDNSDVVMDVIFKKIARAKDCAVVYNILFKNFARILKMTRFKDKFYDHKAAHRIPQHNLEIWPGVATSVEEFDGGIQLRCDIKYRVLREETAHDVITTIARRNPLNMKAQVEKDLLGECVMTNYNNNLYRIDDIAWNQCPMNSFEISNGKTITFIEYYKKQYNINIRDAKQPLLISRKKNLQGLKSRLICLVPELCYMTGLTDKMASDMRVMKDVALYTRITPAERARSIRKFLANVKNDKEIQKMLQNWGLSIDDEPMTVHGRNLFSEQLIFGNNAMKPAHNGDWQKCFKDATVYHSVDLLNWYLFFPERDIRVASTFINILRKVGPALGIEISEPIRITLKDDKNETYIHALRKHVNINVQMVVCICPTAREDRYSAIKKFCCKEVPVPSQVINSVTLAREDRLRSVVQNIALQMNVKLGGASWAIYIPFKSSMICGVDTYHDKANKTSVGGFVASCNATFTEWFSRTVFQGPKEEIINGLVQAFHAALQNYYQKFLCYPERIVIYRDGLSEGQMKVCLDFEVAQFIQACKEMNNGYNPKFTYVVVKKRISTKIFQRTVENNADDLVNPSSGDVIDQIITNRSYYDFFLVSQFVRVGTATPCHYVVLYDNSNIKPDHIQRLTYKFCHLYYNWPGTIRVPAPCYYAHKLAYLVGQSIKTLPEKSLENKLYYL